MKIKLILFEIKVYSKVELLNKKIEILIVNILNLIISIMALFFTLLFLITNFNFFKLKSHKIIYCFTL